MKRIIIIAYHFLTIYLPSFISELNRKNGNYLIINGFLCFKWGTFKKSNWGDDLNYFLCRKLFCGDVISYQSSIVSKLLCRTNYMFIGSMLHDANKHTIVWGSGLLSPNLLPKEQPQEILAVRGKLTHDILTSNGFICPNVYGDPALLLPLIYNPVVLNKKYKIGIIPHIHDQNNPIIREYAIANKDVCVIDLKKYNSWHDVIDQIRLCKAILSSSLHGIIVSDAYNIPNVWIKLSDKVYGNGFKFLDYFSSVKRQTSRPIIINKKTDLENAISELNNYVAITYSPEALLKTCPLKLKIK